MLIAGLVTGYMTKGKPLEGLLNGALIGLIAGCVMALIGFVLALLIGESAGWGEDFQQDHQIGTIIYLIIIYGIIASFGGAVGAIIKNLT